MPRITFIAFDGTTTRVDAGTDMTLMEAAVENDIAGIVAECGGSCSCATCHVYIDPEWTKRVGPPNTIENDMLESADERAENSRLSCQVKVTDELDGLVVRLPEHQI